MSDLDRTLRWCTRYWRRTKVPRSAIADMRVELESHLRDAAAEGRPVAPVVGGDLQAFAERWAQEYRPPYAVPGVGARVGPAILSLLVAMSMFFLSFLIPTGSAAVTEVCCPRRVVEGPVETIGSGLALVWIMMAIAALTLVAAVLFLAGRLMTASLLAAAAAPLTLVTPPPLLATGLLIAAFVWGQWGLRRSESRAAAGVP